MGTQDEEDETMGGGGKREGRRDKPGQRAMLQSLLWVSGPSQALPPCWGGTQFLDRVRWPRPQVNEHRLQGDHSSQTPCTADRRQDLQRLLHLSLSFSLSLSRSLSLSLSLCLSLTHSLSLLQTHTEQLTKTHTH